MFNNMNNLRNNYSLSHPNKSLLLISEFMFSLNLARSIMKYYDNLLKDV